MTNNSSEMKCVSYKSEIESTFSTVRTFSYNEKKSPLLDEERVSTFLDAINDFKESLNAKTQKFDDLNERIEKLTWFNDLNEECLMLTNDLISSAKDLHSSLCRQYASLNSIRGRGIGKKEIKEFKRSIDDLRETYQDLESVFFFLPEFPDFIETTKQLSLV